MKKRIIAGLFVCLLVVVNLVTVTSAITINPTSTNIISTFVHPMIDPPDT